MKIALLGYGKMGQAIEQVALKRGHEIVLRKTSADTFEGLHAADVAIDFSVPESAVRNIEQCFETNIPIVSGTTGWLKDYDKVTLWCEEKKGAFIYASNFSLGVNIFFEMNDYLARIMTKFNQYKVTISEIHHTQKLDTPSGTAITLAKGIIDNADYSSWALEDAKADEILIEAKRIANVPGTHTVSYHSEVDTIQIKHTAHNREGFALGAIMAAEWLVGKTGVFTMKDVLHLDNIK